MMKKNGKHVRMVYGLMMLAALSMIAGLAQGQPGRGNLAGTSGTQMRARAGGARRGTGMGVGMGATTKKAVVQVHSPRDDGQWSPSTFDKIKPGLPTLFIAGDSTAATGDPAHRGWAAVLIDFFDTSKLNIVNCAVGGRSFRTFTSEGRWDKLAAQLKPGDLVIIEFGHNDGGGAQSMTGRGDVPGIGEETATVTKRDGTTETVHTFGWYARKYVRDAKAKGAKPILSTTTVRNIWTAGKVERGMGKMSEWAKQVATQEDVPFLDHSNITADVYEKIGETAATKFHPADHTHTSTEGAINNAETLIAGLKALPVKPLVDALNEKGQAIPAYQAPAAK